jgi:hypothetical protein
VLAVPTLLLVSMALTVLRLTVPCAGSPRIG